MKFPYIIYFETITEESSREGDCEERGTEEEGISESLQEIVSLISDKGFSELSCYPLYADSHPERFNHVWINTVDAEIDYQTGENKYYSLFIDTSPNNLRRIYCLAGLLQKRQ